MTDLIDRIGPYLGIAAFLGLAILAFLIIQQAREIRRLRNWAGRAPERADEAEEAEAAVAEAQGEEVEQPEPEELPPIRVGGRFQGARDWMADRAAELDRRLPVDPRFLIAGLAAVVIAVVVLTGAFGLVGGSDSSTSGHGGKGGGKSKPAKVEVSVLNATQEQAADGTEIAGVQGLADVVAKQVVQPLDGYKIGAKTDAPSGLDRTTIMFEPDFEDDANKLAQEVAGQLGESDVTPIIADVRAAGKGAPLVLLVGRNDADFGP